MCFLGPERCLIAGLLLLCFPAISGAADTAKLTARGKTILQEKCGRCHAVEVVGESPLKIAPPMRDIYARFVPRELQEELLEGKVSRHKEMPQIEFSPEDVDAILAYLYALAVRKSDPGAQAQVASWPRSIAVMKALFWLFVLALPFAFPHPVNAEPLDFGPNLSRSGWVVVRFPRIPPASFRAADRSTLEVSTEAAAGLLWRRMREARHQGRLANWRWMVTEGVPPTDLTRRGKDDRTLGVYFIFGIAADASKAPLALLGSPSVSALVYVFGGDKPRGSMLSSPHMGARGRFIILRPADAQKGAWFDETVDLAKDYARAFHTPPPLLIAIAISSDSDDTGRRSQATLRSLAIGR